MEPHSPGTRGGALPGHRIGFIIGGVQKGGTTALARLLGEHPSLALPHAKEAHVFDAPDFDDAWSPADIDAAFAPHFAHAASGCMRGDATPITLWQPFLVQRVARYNPSMRWIVLLRDPVDRAISHYHMERHRGLEPRGLLTALLLEPWRLRRHAGDWSWQSPLRICGYASRSRYAGQLSELARHFPPEQMLLLRTLDLEQRPADVLARVHAFLGVPPLPAGEGMGERVFAGKYVPPRRWAPARVLLGLMLRKEYGKLRSAWGIDLRPPRVPGRGGSD